MSEHANTRKQIKLLGIPPEALVGALAVLLAIVSIASGRLEVKALLYQGKSSDTLAQYNTSVYQQHIDTNLASVMRGIARGAPEHQGLTYEASVLEARVRTEHAAKQRELLAQGEEDITQRDHYLNRHHNLQFAEAGLEIAIVIASLAALFALSYLEGIALALGLASVILAGIGLLTSNGLGL